jgi:flagellar hook protein FlgE
VSITDSLGKRHEFYILFNKARPNTWNYTLQEDDPRTSPTEDDPDFALGGTISGRLVFDADGNLNLAASNISAVVLNSTAGGASSITVTPDFSRLTQLAAPYSANAAANGAPAGSLTTFTVSQSGQVLGIYSNGVTKVIGQIALALFTNPGGLMKVGGNAYLPTVNSGEPIVGPADSGGRGKIASGYLEMSNVDLAQEFTSMIMAQRGFQANSRVITTSDEVLQELVNLRR